MTDYTAYDSHLPCKNPECASRGKPHPNCHCYASGGCVAHCPHYAVGGSIAPQVSEPIDNLPKTFGLAGASLGLMGFLKKPQKLMDPDSHHQKIHDLKNNPSEDLHTHPIASGVSKKNLGAIQARLAGPIQSQETYPEALHGAVHYLDASMKGESALSEKMKNLIGEKKMEHESDKDGEVALKKRLKELAMNPKEMLEIAPHLGHYLPDHAVMISSQMAVATNYLRTLEPRPQQITPLDTPEQVDKSDQAMYDRQVSLAHKPLSLLNRVKNGTLIPQDITTVQTIYPGLFHEMKVKAIEALAEAQEKKEPIPYKQRQTLSLVLGEPLDFTQTPMAAQAIMSAQRTLTPSEDESKPGKKGPKRSDNVTATELKAIEKSDEMVETSTEVNQINRRAR